MIDPTFAIATSQNAFFDAATIITNDYVFLFITLVLASLLIWRKTHQPVSILLAILLTAAMIPAVKTFYEQARPCQLNPALTKGECPTDPGFPSSHAALAFVLVAAAIPSRLFLLYFPFGLLVIFLRVYEGVHSAGQVAGGMALGLSVFFILSALLEKIDLKAEALLGVSHGRKV
jgi:membrane-associated phospholipid phosphatase